MWLVVLKLYTMLSVTVQLHFYSQLTMFHSRQISPAGHLRIVAIPPHVGLQTTWMILHLLVSLLLFCMHPYRCMCPSELQNHLKSLTGPYDFASQSIPPKTWDLSSDTSQRLGLVGCTGAKTVLPWIVKYVSLQTLGDAISFLAMCRVIVQALIIM